MGVCDDFIKQAAGRDLSETEINEIIDVLNKKKDAIKAKEASLNAEDLTIKAIDELKSEVELAALIEKRNAYINLRRRTEAVQYLVANWSDNLSLGLESFLVGTNVARLGSRHSVDATQKELVQSYIAGFINDVEKAGHWQVLSSGAQDREISRALWQLNQESPD